MQERRRLAPPFFTSEEVTEKANGRISTRQSSVWGLEDPAEIGIAHMVTLVVTQRRTVEIKTGKASSDTAHHLSSQDVAVRSANQWAKYIRDHWGIESRDHGRRDNWLFEDKTRSKNPAIVANFCMLRAVVLYFNAQTESGNINSFVESCRESKRHTLSLIMRRRGAK